MESNTETVIPDGTAAANPEESPDWRQVLGAAAGVLWCVFFAARWRYFGMLLPNTAGAQDIAVTERLLALLSGDIQLRAASIALVKRIALSHLGFVVAASLPLFLFTQWNRRYLPAAALFGVLVVTTLSTPFLFGEARLDPTRLSTQMAPAAVFLAAILLVGVRRWWLQALLTAAFAVTMVGGVQRFSQEPYYLWFSEGVFENYRGEIVKIREKHGIPRPTLANPDLGLMSWHKDANIVDLGLLGNPVLARLGGETLKADYFFDIAAPDIIELHGMWSAMYAPFFRDPRFAERYVAEKSIIDWYLRKRFAQSPSFRAEYGDVVREGYWVRRDMLADSGTRERALTDALREAVSLEPLRVELAYCAAKGLSGWEASYVARCAYRFLPEFRAAGLHGELMALMKEHAEPLDFSTALLDASANPNWHQELLRFVEDYSAERVSRNIERDYERYFAPREAAGAQHTSIIAGDLTLRDVYFEPLDGQRLRLALLFEAKGPLWKDWRIFIHAEAPKERHGELPAEQRGLGFLNWDIPLPVLPASAWHTRERVVLTRIVTAHPAVKQVRLGLYLPGEGVYGTDVLIPLPAW